MIDAQLDARAYQSSQPASTDAKRPNAARAKSDGPPVASNRLAASANDRAIAIESAPTATSAHGLHAPTLAASSDGIRKIDPPTTWLTPMAVRSHRPRARMSEGWAWAMNAGGCTTPVLPVPEKTTPPSAR